MPNLDNSKHLKMLKQNPFPGWIMCYVSIHLTCAFLTLLYQETITVKPQDAPSVGSSVSPSAWRIAHCIGVRNNPHT